MNLIFSSFLPYQSGIRRRWEMSIYNLFIFYFELSWACRRIRRGNKWYICKRLLYHCCCRCHHHRMNTLNRIGWRCQWALLQCRCGYPGLSVTCSLGSAWCGMAERLKGGGVGKQNEKWNETNYNNLMNVKARSVTRWMQQWQQHQCQFPCQ